MSAESSHSVACCTIAPIVAKDYHPLGKYETIGGIKTYITGPENSTAGILFIYDIFGFASQTIQGADILANSDKKHPYKIFIPDFFNGEYGQGSWFASEEGKKVHLANWFKNHGPPTAVKQIPQILESINALYTQIDRWGAVGFCWGGKVTTLTSQEGTSWKAAAQCHPVMLDANDATRIVVPFCSIVSKDEPADVHQQFGDSLKVEKRIETYNDQLHGFMAARADLQTESSRMGYESGYKVLLDFFGTYL